MKMKFQRIKFSLMRVLSLFLEAFAFMSIEVGCQQDIIHIRDLRTKYQGAAKIHGKEDIA